MSRTPTARLRSWRFALWLPICVIVTSCGGEAAPLRLADLTSAEHLYVTRVITLERAKAVALLDPIKGHALLDSLRSAWGDSSQEATLAAAPSDPRRATQVGALLVRMLDAEHDSLAVRPEEVRLDASLPDPEPPRPAAAGDD